MWARSAAVSTELCNRRQPATANAATVSPNVTDRLDVRRLILQIERDVTARDRLLTLLEAAELVLVDRRHELRTIKARIKRRGQMPPT